MGESYEEGEDEGRAGEDCRGVGGQNVSMGEGGEGEEGGSEGEEGEGAGGDKGKSVNVCEDEGVKRDEEVKWMRGGGKVTTLLDMGFTYNISEGQGKVLDSTGGAPTAHSKRGERKRKVTNLHSGRGSGVHSDIDVKSSGIRKYLKPRRLIGDNLCLLTPDLENLSNIQ